MNRSRWALTGAPRYLSGRPPTLDRRSFLRLLGLGAAAVALPGCGSDDDDAAAAERVIVIGAGVSGLTVANALNTAGMETIVLEGRERLGGRVHTAEFGGALVDLGGAWLSGTEGSPSACILSREGIAWQSAEPVDLGVAVYDAMAGQLLTTGELVDAAVVLAEFDEALPSLIESLGPTATIGDAVERIVSDLGLAGNERFRAESLAAISNETTFAAPMDRIALDSYAVSNAFPGGEHFPDGGYSGLTAALARGVDVRFGSTVASIAYDDEGVVVESSTGTYRGTHAVVTVPLGVLKAGSIEFSPALPERKQAAIDRLAMGTLEKVVLRFDEAFWRAPDRTNLVYLSRERGEFPFFADLTPYTGEPILACLYCGDFAERAGAMSDDELIGRAAEIVGEVSGVTGRRPTEGRATRWRSDPFAFGAYSYLPVGSSGADLEVLAEPVGSRLLFAGEATSAMYSGYVHGGIVSGAREAARLIGGPPVLESGVVASAGCGMA